MGELEVVHLDEGLERLLGADVLQVNLGGLVELAGGDQVDVSGLRDGAERLAQRAAVVDGDRRDGQQGCEQGGDHDEALASVPSRFSASTLVTSMPARPT